MDDLAGAQRLLRERKGDSYRFGNHALDTIGDATRDFGDTTLIVKTDPLGYSRAKPSRHR
jgi:hypothetical protein